MCVGQNLAVPADWGWPESDEELVELQGRLATAAASILTADPWLPSSDRPILGGCFIAYARGTAGPGRTGDRAWAAAVAWRRNAVDPSNRKTDHHLRGVVTPGRPRQADDVLAQSIVASRSPLPLRARALGPQRGTGPRLQRWRHSRCVLKSCWSTRAESTIPASAGLAVQLGAVANLPTVGVTRRPLVAIGDRARTPARIRGTAGRGRSLCRLLGVHEDRRPADRRARGMANQPGDRHRASCLTHLLRPPERRSRSRKRDTWRTRREALDFPRPLQLANDGVSSSHCQRVTSLKEMVPESTAPIGDPQRPGLRAWLPVAGSAQSRTA